MGNSCPPCQCNTDSDRPYYDLAKVTLKGMECMPKDMDCINKHQTELTAALMKTDCPDVKWENNELSGCMQALSEEKRNNALKECNDAVGNYLKSFNPTNPNLAISFNPGQGAISVNQLCTQMFEVQPSKPSNSS